MAGIAGRCGRSSTRRAVLVRGGEDAGGHRQLPGGQAAVVPAAVTALVVLADQPRDVREGRRPGEDPLAVVRMQPGLVTLGGAQRPGLVPDPARHPDPADVVEVAGDADGPHLAGQPEAADRRRRELGHGRGVPLQPRALEVGQASEGPRHRLDPVLVDHDHRVGLRRERLLVAVQLGEVPDELVGPVDEDLGDSGVQVRARPPPDLGHGLGLAGVEGEQGSRRRDVHEPGDQGDVVPRHRRVPLPSHIVRAWKRSACTDWGVRATATRPGPPRTWRRARRPRPSSPWSGPWRRRAPRGAGGVGKAGDPRAPHVLRSAKFVRKARRTTAMSSPQTSAPSWAYAVQPRCCRSEV